MQDKGGKLNQPQVNKITTAMEGGLKTQKEFAKKLGITHKQFLYGVEKSKSKKSQYLFDMICKPYGKSFFLEL